MRGTVVGLTSLWLLWAGLPAAGEDSRYGTEIARWREDRMSRLRSESGWLTLAGLYWLKDGTHRVGSDPDGDIVFPAGRCPAKVGTLVVAGAKVHFTAEPGVEVRRKGESVRDLDLRSDADAETDVLEIGPLSFYVIRRGERLALRLKDKENPARLSFHGIEAWPADPKWRVVGRFEPYPAPREVDVPTIYGEAERMPSPGVVVFTLDGSEHRLAPVIEKGETQYFFVFGDETNGRESYGAGRFLYADPPVGDKIVLDFNKAYNPPCVFTPYATCPLPPPGNRLPLRVEAGEKKYGDH